ncbi:MAG: hypothetical protein COB12_12435 [Flavobacterium sp.]|nr:MAG: hypothetical protein COB12_12435 [Flavobacterium sp.]
MISLAASPAFALDIITRKSVETRIAGKITSISKTEVKIKPQTGADVTIPANDIQSIKWDDDTPLMNIAIGQEKIGNYEAAIKSLQDAKAKVPAAAENIRTDIDFFSARVLAKFALADQTRLPDAVARMKKFTDSNATSFRFYEAIGFLGQLYLAQKDYIKAEAAFSSLERSPFADQQLSAKSSKAHVLLAQNQIDKALQAFEQVIKSPAKDEASKQRQLEAMLGKANCLNLKSQPEEALKLLDIVVEKANESDVRLQAQTQILRGTSLLAGGKNQEALLAYLLVDVMFSGQQDLHAESLYNLSQLWVTIGKPGRADEARAILESKYPNSPWAKKLSGG